MEKARVGKSACDCGAFIWDRTLQTRAPSPLKTSLTGHGIGPRPQGDATVVSGALMKTSFEFLQACSNLFFGVVDGARRSKS